MNFDEYGQNMIKAKKRSPVTDVIGLLSFFLLSYFFNTSSFTT